MIVPFAAGGGTDIGTRIVTKYAEKYLGQPLVVKNIDGGGSEVGVTEMVNSPADGYTISGFNSASVTLCTMRDANYHPIDELSPSALQSQTRGCLQLELMKQGLPMRKALSNMQGRTRTN